MGKKGHLIDFDSSIGVGGRLAVLSIAETAYLLRFPPHSQLYGLQRMVRKREKNAWMHLMLNPEAGGL